MRHRVAVLAAVAAATAFWASLPSAVVGSPPAPACLPLTPSERQQERANAVAEQERETGERPVVLRRGDTRLKEIALTFDDGPHPAWTPKLLRVLRSLNVRATFFLVGKMVDRYPELAAREVALGHEVANHTYDHTRLAAQPEARVECELREGADAIRRVTGFTPEYFRPPGGEMSPAVREAAAHLGYTAVMWTANSKDFTYPDPGVLESRLLGPSLNGAILLCHDGIPQTMHVLPDLVARLRAQGYRFVTVSELARHAAEAPEAQEPGVEEGVAARESPTMRRTEPPHARCADGPAPAAARRGARDGTL